MFAIIKYYWQRNKTKIIEKLQLQAKKKDEKSTKKTTTTTNYSLHTILSFRLALLIWNRKTALFTLNIYILNNAIWTFCLHLFGNQKRKNTFNKLLFTSLLLLFLLLLLLLLLLKNFDHFKQEKKQTNKSSKALCKMKIISFKSFSVHLFHFWICFVLHIAIWFFFFALFLECYSNFSYRKFSRKSNQILFDLTSVANH